MIRNSCIALFIIFHCSLTFSQIDDSWTDAGFENKDSIPVFLTTGQVDEYLNSLRHNDDEIVIGGYISSVFHQAIDSALIDFRIDGQQVGVIYAEDGLFAFFADKKKRGKVIDIFVTHPEFHSLDTSLIFPDATITNLNLSLTPRFRILLRGRVYAGNMPLDGVGVKIAHLDKIYQTQTLGCYYDNEQYWNCLYDGMFKKELIADTPDDSISILLTMDGMKPYQYGMTFREYQGNIMKFKMKYEPLLPSPPRYNINLKLGFPFISLYEDWYVSLSFYKHVRNITRLGYGLDVNMYVTNYSVPVETFEGLEPALADSSYINAFIGPTILYYFIVPDRRFFSSYAGCTFSLNLTETALIPQVFLGSRIFLDFNKALSLELRYSQFERTVTHYTFNPYGIAYTYSNRELFTKLHANLGIQIVF